MKNYNVLALIDFYDKEEKIQRVVGEETSKFKCTKERYEYLSGNNDKKLVAVKLLNIDEENKEEIIIVGNTGTGLGIGKSDISLEVKKPKKATKRKVK